MKEFKIGDLVVRKGTLSPIMEIKGQTLHGGNPYQGDENKYTCYWIEKGEPNWEPFHKDDLEISNKKEV